MTDAQLVVWESTRDIDCSVSAAARVLWAHDNRAASYPLDRAALVFGEFGHGKD